MGEIVYTGMPHRELKLRILALLDETVWRTERELHAADERLPLETTYQILGKLEVEYGDVVSRMRGTEREYLRTPAGTEFMAKSAAPAVRLGEPDRSGLTGP